MNEKKKGRRDAFIAVAIGMVVIVAVLAFLQRLVMPKYMGDVKEGALIGEYYDEYHIKIFFFIIVLTNQCTFFYIAHIFGHYQPL